MIGTEYIIIFLISFVTIFVLFLIADRRIEKQDMIDMLVCSAILFLILITFYTMYQTVNSY